VSNIRKAIFSIAFLLFFISLISNGFASPSITLYEPQNITYNTDSGIPLNFTVNETVNVTIFIDDVKIESNCYETIVNETYNETYCYLVNIIGWDTTIYTTNGSHYLNITVYNSNGSDYKEVYFTKNSSLPPGHTTYISSCGVITTSDTYILTQDIIDSSAYYCMDIQANNVILDCQGHIIDGIGRGYGIYVVRSDTWAIVTNITIKNCVLTNWSYGLYFYFSSSNIMKNITVSSNGYGITIYKCSSNTITDSVVNSNGVGLNFWYSDADLIYNNIFNNTNNFLIDNPPGWGANYWNTTKQPGTNIWNSSLGFIGGNLWTNPNGTGYSDTCKDANYDGFCDDPYNLTTNNLDYLPIAKSVGQYAPALSVTFNFNKVDFGTVNIYQYNPALNQELGIYNVTVSSSSNYVVKVYAYDWSGLQTIPANTLYIDTNETLSNLSFDSKVQLSTTNVTIDTYPASVTENYYAFWFYAPLVKPGSYTTTMVITYEIA